LEPLFFGAQPIAASASNIEFDITAGYRAVVFSHRAGLSYGSDLHAADTSSIHDLVLSVRVLRDLSCQQGDRGRLRVAGHIGDLHT
jgi:hypothetical protein